MFPFGIHKKTLQSEANSHYWFILNSESFLNRARGGFAPQAHVIHGPWTGSVYRCCSASQLGALLQLASRFRVVLAFAWGAAGTHSASHGLLTLSVYPGLCLRCAELDTDLLIIASRCSLDGFSPTWLLEPVRVLAYLLLRAQHPSEAIGQPFPRDVPIKLQIKY
jgi:hypothetical protein